MVLQTFRNKKFKKYIRIRLKDDLGQVTQVWEYETLKLLAYCKKITEEYLGKNIRITLRQLYYDLVSLNIMPNHDTVYKKLSSVLTDGRYNGMIDWESIEDRNRPSDMHGEWDNIHDIMQSAIYSYRLPRWSDQDYYVEVFSEKDALYNILQPVTNKWHVQLNINKGYSSASIMFELACRVAEKIKVGKEVVILYIGDHDPSGLDMVRDVEERTKEFLWVMLENHYFKTDYEKNQIAYQYWINEKFQMRHIALTMEQIKELNPPPNPAKITDPRAKWYINTYGRISWEVEALKADYLIKLLDDTIQEYLEPTSYEDWLGKEEIDKLKMKKFAKKFKEENKDNGKDN